MEPHWKQKAWTMKSCGRRAMGGLILLLSLTLAAPGGSEGQTAEYLDYQAFTNELQGLVNRSDMATLESLGTTLGGREIWMVRVGSPGGSPMDERPGVLVVGNLEGDHVAGSQLSLEAIRYLVTQAENEGVRRILSETVFYFFPRLNPDGAEAMFAPVKVNRRTNQQPRDEDNDGRMDEDGPEDLNGDGFITVMRVPDPAGRFMIDTADARAMKRADPSKGEKGAYTLYWEGRDNDGDGFINEDGPGGVDLNRNFQHAYPYWTGDGGPHMVSEVESRALMDFVLDHRNIAAILAFGESDNLVTSPDARGELAADRMPMLPTFADASLAEVFARGIAPNNDGSNRGRGFGGRRGGSQFLRGAQPGRDNDPSSGVRPATTVATQDQVFFKAVSDAYRRITGIENVPIHRKPEGAFFQYGYFQFGVPSFSTLGWGLPKVEANDQATGGQRRATGAEPSERTARSGSGSAAGTRSDASLLAQMEAAGIDAMAPWTPFDHPELGEVEIGGILPYVTHNPPADQLPGLGAKHGEFLVELAGMLPRARIGKTEVEALGEGLFKVEAEVENSGFFPTSLRHGQTSRSVGPTFLQIQVEEDDILSGAEKTASVGVLAGSGSRESVTWIIRGRAGATVEIKLISQKAGRDSSTVTLR